MKISRTTDREGTRVITCTKTNERVWSSGALLDYVSSDDLLVSNNNFTQEEDQVGQEGSYDEKRPPGTRGVF